MSSVAFRVTVTAQSVRVTSSPVETFDVSYDTDTLSLIIPDSANRPREIVFYRVGLETDGTTVDYAKCINIRATSATDFISRVNTLITTALAAGSFDTLTVSGAITGGSVTTAGSVTAGTVSSSGAITADSVTATNAVTGGSLSTTGALSANSATLGTMTVSSAGALGGTYNLGKRVYVQWDWILNNVSGSFQLQLTSTVGLVYRVHKWPYTVNWVGYTLGSDDFTGTFESKVSRNITEISTQSVATTTATIPVYVALATPFTTTDGDNIRFSTRQTAGTTGSELTVTLFGYYEI